MKLVNVISAIGGVVFLCSCLPGDTRPTPGRVFLTAEPSAAMTEGVVTEDGWKIEFERALVGLGNGSLEGEGCNDYEAGRYGRLFDFTVPGAQKLCEVYGLGHCDIVLRLRVPPQDALLEKGVSAADLTFMRTPDPNAPLPAEPIFGSLGTSVYVRGRATRGGETKIFEWKFPDRFFLTNCGSGEDSPFTSEVNLAGGDDKRVQVVFHGEDLFRTSTEEGAGLRFDLLAGADADGDGTVTMEELGQLPAPIEEMDGGVVDAGAVDGGVLGETFADFMGQKLLARAVHLDQGACKALEARHDR